MKPHAERMRFFVNKNRVSVFINFVGGFINVNLIITDCVAEHIVVENGFIFVIEAVEQKCACQAVIVERIIFFAVNTVRLANCVKLAVINRINMTYFKLVLLCDEFVFIRHIF